MGPSSRRPSDSSLPLHEAWMQHEAEWAQLNRVGCSHLYTARIISLSFYKVAYFVECTECLGVISLAVVSPSLRLRVLYSCTG